MGEAYHEWSGLMLADIVDRVLRDELVGERADRGSGSGTGSGSSTGPRSSRSGCSASSTSRSGISKAGSLGVPVHRLLGTYRDSIPAYASTTTFATVEEYLDVCDQCLELGYPAIKLHAWGDARADARSLPARACARRPDVDLMYDGSAGFDLPDADLSRAMRSPRRATAGTRSRCASSTSRRTSGWRSGARSRCSSARRLTAVHLNTADFIASGCATYVRTSANHRGGITGAMRIAHLADSFRLRAEVHGPTESAVHLCMAIPNTHVLRVARHLEPGRARAPRRSGRSGPRPHDPGHRIARLRP